MKNFGNSSRGSSQGVPKIFRAPTYGAHCAVIFAIAQLSHEVPHSLYMSKFTRLRAVSPATARLLYIILWSKFQLQSLDAWMNAAKIALNPN